MFGFLAVLFFLSGASALVYQLLWLRLLGLVLGVTVHAASVPARRQMLAELGITNFEKLRALDRAGPDELRRYLGSGPVLTDDRPLAEYFLSLPRDRQVDLSSLTGDVDRYVDDGPSAR